MNVDPKVIEDTRVFLSSIFPSVTIPQAVLVYCNLVSNGDRSAVDEKLAFAASMIKENNKGE